MRNPAHTEHGGKLDGSVVSGPTAHVLPSVAALSGTAEQEDTYNAQLSLLWTPIRNSHKALHFLSAALYFSVPAIATVESE